LLNDADYKRLWYGLRVRIGIHHGLGSIKFDEITKGYDYYGPLANVAARTESAGHGGQILVTQDVLDALAPEVRQRHVFASVGAIALRGVPEPMELFDVQAIEGRMFLPLQDAEPQPSTQLGEDECDAPLETSLSSHFTAPSDADAGSASSRPHHADTAKRWIHLLLSTTDRAARQTLLEALCAAWRIGVPDGMAHTPLLLDDPYLAALGRKLAPIMREQEAKSDRLHPVQSWALRRDEDLSGGRNHRSVLVQSLEMSPLREREMAVPANKGLPLEWKENNVYMISESRAA
jgi:adenylate cyclase